MKPAATLPAIMQTAAPTAPPRESGIAEAADAILRTLPAVQVIFAKCRATATLLAWQSVHQPYRLMRLRSSPPPRPGLTVTSSATAELVAM